MNYKYLYISSKTKFNDAKNLNNLRLNIYFFEKSFPDTAGPQ